MTLQSPDGILRKIKSKRVLVHGASCVIRRLHETKLNKSISTEISYAPQARVNNSGKYGLARREAPDILHFHATLEDFHIPISSAMDNAIQSPNIKSTLL
jgi:hypothetical protein